MGKVSVVGKVGVDEVSVVGEVGVERDSKVVITEWQGDDGCYQCHLDTNTGGRRTKWEVNKRGFTTEDACTHPATSINGILGCNSHGVTHS